MASIYDDPNLQAKLAAEEFDVSGDPKEMFKAASKNAAGEIIRLSTHAASEALRYRAASYILDKVVFMDTRKTDDEVLVDELKDILSGGTE